MTEGDPITFEWNGVLKHGSVLRVGEQILQVEVDGVKTGHQYQLTLSNEGLSWIVGRHEEDSPEVHVMRAARSLAFDPAVFNPFTVQEAPFDQEGED